MYVLLCLLFVDETCWMSAPLSSTELAENVFSTATKNICISKTHVYNSISTTTEFYSLTEN